MTFGNKGRSVLTTVVLATAATGWLTGCGMEDEPEEEVYCVDEDQNVVDDDMCDSDYNGSGSFFFLMGNFGGSGYRVGEKIPGSSHKRIDARSSSARSKAGLSPTGKVSSGTRVSGGIGSGSGGAKGGSAGG